MRMNQISLLILFALVAIAVAQIPSQVPAGREPFPARQVNNRERERLPNELPNQLLTREPFSNQAFVSRSQFDSIRDIDCRQPAANCHFTEEICDSQGRCFRTNGSSLAASVNKMVVIACGIIFAIKKFI
ncbi:CLUMA_CG013894, isoform A [Clunio marinus]|uniref:CLUMA_CG013894, isoform A n=1 Tax=Clunio marinus TaxID=568069 RepID=A0A1J1ILK0_9DIPT|nr:CLUMA_CG013894, isoform A [Clunio marinus]